MPIAENRMPEVETVQRLVEELPRILPNLILEKISREVKLDSGSRADLVVRVRAGNLVRNLIVEVKSIGEPRMAEQAITQLLRMAAAFPQSYPVFGAPYVSRRAREICKAAGVGFIDLAGDAYLRFGSVLVDKAGVDGKPLERRSLRSLLAPKATRVVRALLEAPTEPRRITDLADRTSMSVGGVFRVVDLLETKGLVVRGPGKALTVPEPGRLLLEWARDWSVDKSETRRYFSFERTPEAIISRIAAAAKDTGSRYALTGMAGASFVAPFVRYEDVWAYVAAGSERLIDQLELRPVSSGANVVLLEPYDQGVFTGVREIRGSQVVSNVQLFVDLYNYPARGREQAEEILERAIKFPEAR